MKPEVLSRTDFEFQKGYRVPEQDALLRTLELASSVRSDDPTFVELGVFKAYTSRMVILALNELDCSCKFFAVDLDQEYWEHVKKIKGNWWPSKEFDKLCKTISEVGACKGKFVKECSHEFASELADDTLCWCFVDACHCYQCVKQDLAAYCPKMAVGGYLIMHDTVHGNDKSQWYHDKKNPRPFGVSKAINDCKMLHENFELLHEVKVNRGMQIWRRRR